MILIAIDLPHKDLSPNARKHWRDVSKLKKKLREHVYWVVKERHPEIVGVLWESATIQYKFYFPNKIHRDDDNAAASMKAARDALGPTTYWKSGKRKGLVKGLGVGMISDDCGFTQLPTIMDIDRTNPRVEIHIENTTKGTR